MTGPHYCPKCSATFEDMLGRRPLSEGESKMADRFKPMEMQPINVHSEGSGSEMPLYTYVGDYALRAWRCPQCGYVESFIEKPERPYYYVRGVLEYAPRPESSQ
jgi:hypothetical protein